MERTVVAKSCEEVVDALALITALAFDPEASSKPRAPEVEAPKPSEPVADRPVASPALVWSFDMGLGLVPFDSVLPGNALGFAAQVGVSSEGTSFAPELLAVGERRSGEASGAGGRAQFSLTTFALLGCPVRAPATGPLAIRPCAGFEIGSLHAEGVGVIVEKRPSRLWTAPIVGGRGEWAFAAPFVAHLSLFASFPLTRQHYFFDSGERVHDIPRVSASFEVGVGVRLR